MRVLSWLMTMLHVAPIPAASTPEGVLQRDVDTLHRLLREMGAVSRGIQSDHDAAIGRPAPPSSVEGETHN